MTFAVAISAAGCGDADRQVHKEHQGPLSAYSGGGGFAMAEPRGRGPWFSTHGEYFLCSTEPGVTIELQAVGWEEAADVRAIAVTPWLRTVDRSMKPTTSVGSVVGRPWKPVGAKPYPGRFTRQVRGRLITQTCDDIRNGWDEATHSQPEFTELVFDIKTSRAGAHITRAYIDYTVDGEQFRLSMRRQMIACGSAIRARPSREWCHMRTD